MASVFTFDPDLPRVSSPWTTSGSSTPQRKRSSIFLGDNDEGVNLLDPTNPNFLAECGIAKLDPEPQEGPTEYKLHLLLRPRRSFLSLSTGNLVSGSSHSKSSLAISATPYDSPDSALKPAQSSSGQSRQHRLHQLTTQLLWRLQQSSPFHSSSAANLVLPVLPEATPALNIPQTLSSLLPGLEESQGALYEIGVSDDGTFVGLAADELNESLVNLEAMAASLGCKVEVLRKVAVGYCQWENCTSTADLAHFVDSGKLWVAEALVSPDLREHSVDSNACPDKDTSITSNLTTGLEGLQIKPTEQLHVAIAGPTGAGKSSLLGILSTSALDNGRGKSRLSLLKHRHEIASGVTSSIAQELIGYPHQDPNSDAEVNKVLNCADGNIASWNDIHASANGGRLVFLSDLPGSLKYSKSTLRGLVSWRPHYVVLCVPGTPPDAPGSDISQIDISLSYFELCVKLELPIVIVVTKFDSAILSGLKGSLARILTAIKSSGRDPMLLPRLPEAFDHGPDLQRISAEDWKAVNSARKTVAGDGMNIVPVVMTSAVTGAGIGQLHALLKSLPIPKADISKSLVSNGDTTKRVESQKLFDINEVFEMPLLKVYSLSSENKRKDDRGIILCGSVRHGTIRVGDRLLVGPFSSDSRFEHDSSSPLRPRGGSSRACSDDITSLRLRNLEASKSQTQLSRHSYWQEVRVLSVRNLRLPAKALSEHQVGTIGVDPVEPDSCLGRIHKGMVLADFGHSTLSSSPSTHTSLPPVPPPPPLFHTGFVAKFSAADFVQASPASSLVIGGNAMAYIGSIRAAVKLVTAESASHTQTIPSSMKEPEIFILDDASSSDTEDLPFSTGPGMPFSEGNQIKVTFLFISSIEWVEVGSRVLVMPATLASSSISISRGSTGTCGLQGFAGRVCEVSST